MTKKASETARPESAFRIIRKRYPGLVSRAQGLIEDSEKSFAGNAPEAEGSFLWEHTVHVATLAFKLAEAERRDPLLAAITALFHDAGKFDGGHYHAGEEAEEAGAARLAEPLLKRSRVPAADRESILGALGALYKEGVASNSLADIVHDADFLSKFGYLGVAQFFIKSTLRGRTLRTAIMNSLSKELTYAACLPLNMRTRAGRAAAAQKAEDTLGFYAGLLKELRDVHDLDFHIESIRLPHPDGPRRTTFVFAKSAS